MVDNDKPPIMFPWINSPYVRRVEAWLWGHPKTAIALTVLSVALISSPTWFSDVWSLFYDNAPAPIIMNWIYGLPSISFSWYWLPVGLGSLMLVATASLLWKGRKRLEAEVASSRAKSEPQEQPKTPECQYEKIHRIAEHQATNIEYFVSVSRVVVREHKLKDPVPAIKWGFKIQNESIFPISLVDVGNNLFFENTELAERRSVYLNEAEYIEYGREGSMMFEQRLSGTEAQYIKNTPEGKFRFNRLIVKVGNPNSFPVIKPQELVIGDDLETTLDKVTYKETEGMKSLRKEIALLEQQADELTAQVRQNGLRFEIDADQTQVSTSGGSADRRRVQANVRLRCTKVGDSRLAIKEFSAALFSCGDSGDVEILRHTSQIIYTEPGMNLVEAKNGWTIDDPLTLYRWYMFFFDVENKTLNLLTPRDHFFRITMNAVGQEPQHADFFVDSWRDVSASNSSITLRRPV